MNKRIGSLVLVVIMGIGLLQPGFFVSAATEKENKSKYEATLSEKEKQSQDLTKKYENYLTDTDVPYPTQYLKKNKKTVSGKRRRARAAAVPSSYDSRNAGIETPVKDQSITGTCWAHAILDSAQSDYMTQTGTELDLSEWQMAYFTYQQPVDLLSLTKGDGALQKNQNKKVGKSFPLGSYDYYSQGGNEWLSMFSYAKGIGGGTEEVAPFPQLVSQIDENDQTKAACLNEEKSYLANSYRLTATDIVAIEQRDLLKQMIMQHGAGAISYYSDWSCYDYDFYSYYNSEVRTTNHVVSVVGWDDQYPKEKFKNEPEHDGAWLIKNSWGKHWGNDGYFWLSYDEASIQDEVAIFYSVEDNKYDNVYQYDGSMGDAMTQKDDYSSMANCFTVENPAEQLQEVSFYTIENDVDYEVYVYTDLQDDKDPESGTQAAALKGSKSMPGYCTVKLDEPVALSKGEQYSVVVKEQVAGQNTPLYLDKNVEYEWLRCISKSSAGQSFLYDGEKWEDVSEDGQTNVRVKAFTTNVNQADAKELKFEKKSYAVNAGQSVQTVLRDQDGEPAESGAVTYTVADSLIASVDGQGVVYGKTAGTTTVTASCGKVKTSCEIEVSEIPVTNLTKKDQYATESNPLQIKVGEEVTLSYVKEPEYGTGTLEWTVNGEKQDPYNPEVNTQLYDWYIADDGTFQANKPGDYVVTATITKGETKCSVSYYVTATLELTECGDDVSKLKGEYSGGEQPVKVYTYQGESKQKLLRIHFSSDTTFGNTKAYIIGGTSNVEKALCDYINYEDIYDSSLVGTYTGQELADQSVYVEDDSFAILVVEEEEEDYSFQVDSVEGITPLTYLKYMKKELTYPVGSADVQVLPKIQPADSNEEIVYTSSRPSVATVDADGTVHIGQPGKTVIKATSSYTKKTTSTTIFVEDTSLNYEKISFQKDSITMQRNDEMDLSFNEPIEGFDITYTSSEPGKVYVDQKGHVIAAGVVKDAVITANVTINGTNYSAVTKVTVKAPDTMTVQNMQSVHSYIPGMDEYYTYKAEDDASAVRLFFDEKSGTGWEGDYIEVLDGNKKVIAWYGEEDANVSGDADTHRDSMQYESVTVSGNTATVHIVIPVPEEEESDDEEDSYYGFRVRWAETGKAAESISLDDINLDMTNVNSQKARLKAVLTPSDAVDKVSYTVEDENIAQTGRDGYLYAISNGVTKITATTESGLSATATVTVKGIAIQSIIVGEDGKPISKLTMKGEEEVSYPITILPEQVTENVVIESSNEDIVNAYRQDYDTLYIEALRGGDAVVTVRSTSGGCSQSIPVHVDPKRPGRHTSISDCEDFSTFEDGNLGTKPEQMTIEKLQSAHPYPSEAEIVWSYHDPKAESVTITFDDKTYLEEKCDYLRIYTYDGKGVGKYTGDSLMNQSVVIPGSGFRLVLESDRGEEEYGFALTNITSKEKQGENVDPGTTTPGGTTTTPGGTTTTPGNTTAAPGNQGTATTSAPATTEAPAATPTVSKPAKVKVTSAKNGKGKKLTVKWASVKNAKKYEISYSLKKNFKAAKKVTTKKTSVTIKKLKKGKIYYVRVRAKNAAGWGAYSKAKKVKIKK